MSTIVCDDDILKKFWEIEEQSTSDAVSTVEEQEVLKWKITTEIKFVVLLPKRSNVKSLGESRSQTV